MGIGSRLDEQERLLYWNDETNEHSVPHSNYRNVSLFGSFSIDVLFAALNDLNLTAMPISHPQCSTVKLHPEKENAFLINHNSHWMALRKINAIWYHLNSIPCYPFIDSQPIQISDFFLSAHLTKLQKHNCQIFVIRGALPTQWNS